MTTQKWTTAQEEAISARDQSILVSAAAGSGKTAVLVERVLRMVCNPDRPCDIDRFLVVTFTEAAAHEMKKRIGDAISKALSQNPNDYRLRRQTYMLDRASISTLHSFCSKVARRYFHVLDIDPGFRVMDDVESMIMQDDVIDRILARRLDSDPASLGRLPDRFGTSGGFSALKRAVTSIYEFSRSQVDPEHWLETAGRDLSRVWVGEIVRVAMLYLDAGLESLNKALEVADQKAGPQAYTNTLHADRDMFLEALRALEYLTFEPDTKHYWDKAVDVLVSGFGELPAARKVDARLKATAKKLRDMAKDMWDSARKALGRRKSSEIGSDMASSLKDAGELIGLISEFGQEYAYSKQNAGLCDFSDLERFCLLALRVPEIATQIRSEYDEVLVDECQDVSPVQEAIISTVSAQTGERQNLFMVGDVKQSIYRFRLAEPSLFSDRCERYTHDDSAGRLISLSDNFRSTGPVIDAVNCVFERLMTGGPTELAYDVKARLRSNRDGAMVPWVCLLDVQEIKDDPEANVLRATEVEAHHVARKALEMLGRTGAAGVTVFDTKTSSHRAATQGDIVILLRTMQGVADTFAEVLQGYGLKTYAELATGYFEAVEIKTILSLLSVIDNPHQDIHVAAALRSPIFGLTAADLALVRSYHSGDFYDAVLATGKDTTDLSQTCRRFIGLIDTWRTISRRNSVSTLLESIYSVTKYDLTVESLPGGQQRRANLEALFARARQFDSMQQPGLQRFLRFIDRLKERGDDLGPPNSLDQGTDAIRIMSIHKSKGLEFPIVFVSGLGREWNRRDLQSEFLYHRDLGLGLMMCDYGNRLKFPTLAHRAIASRIRAQSIAEEIRVLYVALTRARDHLLLTGTCKNLPKRAAEWFLEGTETGPAHASILRASRSLDVIGPSLIRLRESRELREIAEEGVAKLEDEPTNRQFFRIECHGDARRLAREPEECRDQDARTADIPAPGTIAAPRDAYPSECSGSGVDEFLIRRLNWVYPYERLSLRRAKVAASEAWRLTDLEDAAPLVFVDRPSGSRDGARRGSVTHLVMQHLDLTKDLTDPSALDNEISRLVSLGKLNAEDVTLVDTSKLGWFFSTWIGSLMLKHNDTVHREVVFTSSVPAASLYSEIRGTPGEDESVIVQGVIDCLIDTPEGSILIDYKTDAVRVSGVELLAEHYYPQMRLYARAASAFRDMPVDRVCLCFMSPGVIWQVPVSVLL